jgi:hypothetical protein
MRARDEGQGLRKRQRHRVVLGWYGAKGVTGDVAMGVLRIHFTAEDVARTTVSDHPDPMWETVFTLHRLQTRQGRVEFSEWLTRAGRDLRSSRLGPMIQSTLLPLARLGSYFPDFLTPRPGGEEIESAVDTVLATPTPRLGRELAELAGAGHRLPAWTADLAAGRGDARRRLGSALRRYFDVAVRPYWHRSIVMVSQDRMVRHAAQAVTPPRPATASRACSRAWPPS